MKRNVRSVPAWIALGAMVLFSLANALTLGGALCGSFGCQAIQNPALWWVGAAYALVLGTAALWRPRFVPWLVSAGLWVEAGLALTQVVLGIYCTACLTYGALLLFYAFSNPYSGRRHRLAFAWVAGGTGATAAVFFLLILSACACSETPYSTLDPKSDEISLVFEPACTHCHSLLDLLQQMDPQRRVKLCPEAWSLRSVWKLVRDHCTTCYRWSDRIRCFMGTAAVVRANNRFCVENGYRQVPLLVVRGRIISGEAIKPALLSALQPPASDLFDGSWISLPGSGGACTINACD
ncbi:hypothetical protein SAMN02745206_01883 [Desulfacinum infernum DSM 9756]|uniref:Uncharacterized protein n=1 Tax=Desulfacinum infernum DSM 9756 TaxID=1121391 RepID=A0A1M5B800_9BACT|nr:hypothetical protein [Desulfacinum infernum]SHF38536.1 hypothetical protein SAMN02745206_01883 [Desulfacinum infernum DSM 9756]